MNELVELPRQGHLRSPVLRWRICGILVPLQTETSESVPCLVISSELIHIKLICSQLLLSVLQHFSRHHLADSADQQMVDDEVQDQDAAKMARYIQNGKDLSIPQAIFGTKAGS